MNITLELISANGPTVGLLISYIGQIAFSFELRYRQRNTLPVMECKIEKTLDKDTKMHLRCIPVQITPSECN